MARGPVPSVAQTTRDEGLRRLRRLTWYSGVGAAALTALASLIAATTIPGHTQGSTASSSGSASSSGDGSGQPAVPDQGSIPPGPGNGSPPQVVSGGS